jgi:hypothetical protein
VAAASNGVAALRLVTEVRPNVVVLGAALPELSGELVAAELMALRHLSGLQVVLASDLLSHALATALQTSREPRLRDQIGAYARRLSAPHPGAANSRVPRASNKMAAAAWYEPLGPHFLSDSHDCCRLTSSRSRVDAYWSRTELLLPRLRCIHCRLPQLKCPYGRPWAPQTPTCDNDLD